MIVHNLTNGSRNNDTIELEFMPNEISCEVRMPITNYDIG